VSSAAEPPRPPSGIVPTSADVPDEYLSAEQRVYVDRAAMAVYCLITLLGVVSAATSKSVADNSFELGVIIFGTTLTLMIAHAWATVVAHRLVQGHRLDRAQILTEFRHDLAFLVTGLFGLATLAVATLLTDDYARQVDNEQTMLVLALVVVGVVGGRRSGASWPRAIGWGLLDGAVGLFIVALKLTLGH